LPNYIFQGQRISGFSGSAGEASFTNNAYYSSGNWYWQNNPGNPANGYVSGIPNGFWYRVPDGSTSGNWHTNLNFNPSDLGQFFGVDNLDPQGYVSVQANVSTQNPALSGGTPNIWADVPVGLTNLKDNGTFRFIEGGPSKDCSSNYHTDCALHPYYSFLDTSQSGVQDQKIMFDINLAPNEVRIYGVKQVSPGSNLWDIYTTKPDGSDYHLLVEANMKSSAAFPYAALGGETARSGLPLGTTNISNVMRQTASYNGFYYWCYDRVVRNNLTSTGTMSGCNPSNFSWTFSW
jgi:hypothetical protein